MKKNALYFNMSKACQSDRRFSGSDTFNCWINLEIFLDRIFLTDMKI